MPKRQSTRDFTKETLTERILNGVYKPGERLVELQIAQELGTSQGPVREALRDLEATGLVESESYKGTRVRQITDKEIEDAYQVRSVLEQLAAELAAPKLSGNVDALKNEVSAFMDAAEKLDMKRYSEHDMEFHRRIIEAAGNDMLTAMWNSVVLESRFRVTLQSRIGEKELVNLGKAHIPIMDALKKGDGIEAGRRASSFARSIQESRLRLNCLQD